MSDAYGAAPLHGRFEGRESRWSLPIAPATPPREVRIHEVASTSALRVGQGVVSEAYSDDELMARIARGEDEAFRLLVERWEKPVFAFLARMSGSAEDAQDLASETFWRVYENAKRYRAAGRFKSWLFRIGGNLGRSQLRRRKILQWVGLDAVAHRATSASARPDERLEKMERKVSVRKALAKLPERQRQAILLRQYEQMSYREIADVLDTSVSAVETLLHRGMKNLGQQLRRTRKAIG